MKVMINGGPVVIPSSLSQINLGQLIDFYQEHGRHLEEKLNDILAIENDIHRELEIAEFELEKKFRTFAFYAGCSLEAVQDVKFIDEVTSIYDACFSVIHEEIEQMEISNSFVWLGELWTIYEGIPVGQMNYYDVVNSLTAIKGLISLGQGDWSAMLKLGALYLRKAGETWQPAFTEEGNDRLALMRALPVNITLNVGYQLAASLNIAVNQLREFNQTLKPSLI